MSKQILSFIALFFLNIYCHADVLVKIRSVDGSTNEIMSNVNATRISMAPDPGYLLVNHETHKIYAVNPEEKTVYDLNFQNPMQQPASEQAINIKLKELGKGPKI
ncbi:MAG: hypothetical protein R3240_05800, partial [Gammaproteobacteria bacterium]|nr:hypothetical protein [Gammaproteobacteria bacterium]